MPDPSPLQKLRTQFQPKIPNALKNLAQLAPKPAENNVEPNSIFKHLNGPAKIKFELQNGLTHTPKRVGVVFSGGPASGGHNVISGLYDALKKLNSKSTLIGFKNGPKGIIENKTLELTHKLIAPYRNQGGFDLIGTGRVKIETPEQFQTAEASIKANQLDGLVIIGGDDSNTNAAFLAEYFKEKDYPISIIGIPKTIDGDLKNEDVEISFGFDTACKTYSEIIGNIMRDTLSAKKYYYFIKLMGRAASHIALECALQTRPNMALISEEIGAERKTFSQITKEICDTICARATASKNYGVILIPEGIIEYIPEFKQLITELNALLAQNSKSNLEKITAQLSESSRQCFLSFPHELQLQLILDRDPHGNVQVSKIETERLFIEMIRTELKKRKENNSYSGAFEPQPLFCGYEGRSCLPTNFDAQYCYALGQTAALLIDTSVTGYICYAHNLTAPVEDWEIGARNLATMMTIEKRHGKEKPVIKKALIELRGKPFLEFKKQRDKWILEDNYCAPGPVQFFGPDEITEAIPITLKLEKSSSLF